MVDTVAVSLFLISRSSSHDHHTHALAVPPSPVFVSAGLFSHFSRLRASFIQGIIGQLTPSSARYDIQSSVFGRAVDAPDEKAKAGSGEDGEAGGEKRGKKRAANGGEDGGVSDDEEPSEEGSEEGSGDDSEDGDPGDASDESYGGDEGGEEEEEEEEEENQGQYHALCKKPDHEPLKEPRFGLCFWNDAVPAEVSMVLVMIAFG